MPTATPSPAPTKTPTPTPVATATAKPTPSPTPTPIATAIVAPSPGQVCHHNCPDLLRFGKSGKPDQLIVRSAFGPGAVIDPNDPVSIVLRNANGIVFSAELLPGDLSLRGKTLVFLDKGAKKGNGIRDGLASVKIAGTPQGSGTRITIEAFADMSAATEAQMTLEITVGDDANAVVDTWESRAYGWYRFHN